MASVDFMKFKGAGHTKAIMRHNDKELREKNEHSNQQIDKDETYLNTSIKGLSYAEICQAYDDRIAFLDENGNKNKRKDRVTAFGLNVPIPKDLTEQQEETWFRRVFEITVEQYGEENVLDMQIHRDEKHQYKNKVTGEWNESRTHGHMMVVPEFDGQLNGKEFSSKKNMIQLNNSIQAMSEAEFGVQFMDGSKTKSRETMETLKFASRQAELDEEAEELREKRLKLNKEKSVLSKRERLADERDRELTERENVLIDVESKVEEISKKAEASFGLVATTRQKDKIKSVLESAVKPITKRTGFSHLQPDAAGNSDPEYEG